MLIGIDGSRAFVSQRTGIEEYSYQVIKNLRNKIKNPQVILYVKKNQKIDFSLPDNWKIKIINFPRFWTQIGLSLEMIFHPVDILFIPAHTVPLIHPASTRGDRSSTRGGPKNTIVAIHGLEYEILPKAYSFWERLYMRWSIKKSCQWASRIIAVSENTKKDLVSLYKIPENKIEVVYEGISDNSSSPACGRGCPEGTGEGENKDSSLIRPSATFSQREKGIFSKPYLLFIGRLEERKNIIGIVRAFEILKEHYKIPHKLVLAGKFGYGEEKIREEIKNINHSSNIVLTGFVSEEEKWNLMKNAEVFLFPTFYEGFGLPILEAQSAGVPVVAGDNSSVPEITKINPPLPSGEDARRAGEGMFSKNPLPSPPPEGEGADYFSAILVNPHNAEEIADKTYQLISDKKLRDDIIEKGYENVKIFSWEKCAEKIVKILKC